MSSRRDHAATIGELFNIPLETLLNTFPTAEYGELRRRMLAIMRETIPPGASVLVASKGDEALLEIEGDRRAWHFPLSETGVYAGHHFADSAAAIAQLEKLRRQGARYFVLPEPSYWWLDHYQEFSDHLEATCRPLTDRNSGCLIFETSAA